MSSESPTRFVQRRRALWWSRLWWRWPLLVWLALALLALWLYDHGGEYIRINGMVEVISESVGPLESGYLKSVYVLPGDEVEAGQVVAEMDTTYIEQQIALLGESLRARTAEDVRQFMSANQRVDEELRTLKLDLAEARSECKVFKAELEQRQSLVDEGFASEEDLLELKARIAVLEERMRMYPDFITALEQQGEQLVQLRSDVLGSSQEGTEAMKGQLQLLEQRRQRYYLRAGQPGIVAEVRRQPGEVVETGERVIEIITRQSPRILAFMDEADTRPIAVGDIIEVEPAIGGLRLEAEVVAISPNVLTLPDRASPIPNRIVRGRRIELMPLEGVDLAPCSSIVVLLPRQEMLWTSLFGGWNP